MVDREEDSKAGINSGKMNSKDKPKKNQPTPGARNQAMPVLLQQEKVQSRVYQAGQCWQCVNLAILRSVELC